MKKLLLAMTLISTPALAQQPTPPIVAPPSAAIDRISLALGQCVGGSEQRMDQINSLQKQLSEVQAKLKELESKESK